jgi:signal transduction histidine kinase
VRDLSQHAKLEAEVLAISERECQRISHDLHDEICQQLTGIEFLCQALQQQLKARGLDELRNATEIAQMVRHTIGQTRELAKGLSPTGSEADGLMKSLGQLADHTQRLYQVNCRFHCPVPILIYDTATSNHLFRIAQEATNNAVRHGQAQRITLSLAAKARRITLRVMDNGIGMNKAAGSGQGMGLQIMQYRASMIKGILRIISRPGAGATVSCSISVEGAEPKSTSTS